MPNYRCKRCGLEANSKCARSRSIFVEDSTEAILSNVMSYEVEHKESGDTITLTLKYQNKRTDNEHVKYFLESIRNLPQKNIDYYACGNHDWELLDEECQLGCCKKGE